MPRRASLVVFFGLASVIMLMVGVSAGAAQEGSQSKQTEVRDAQKRLMQARMDQSASFESYNAALRELNDLDSQISGTEEKLQATEKDLNQAQRELEDRASQVYKSGNVAFMDVLVGVDDFSDFATRLDLWTKLLDKERVEFEDVRQARDELKAQRDLLETQRAQRSKTVEDAINRKEQAENAESDAQAYLDSLSGELRAAIQADQARRAEEARANAEKLREQFAAQQADAPKPAPVQVAQTKETPEQQLSLQAKTPAKAPAKAPAKVPAKEAAAPQPEPEVQTPAPEPQEAAPQSVAPQEDASKPAAPAPEPEQKVQSQESAPPPEPEAKAPAKEDPTKAAAPQPEPEVQTPAPEPQEAAPQKETSKPDPDLVAKQQEAERLAAERSAAADQAKAAQAEAERQAELAAQQAENQQKAAEKKEAQERAAAAQEAERQAKQAEIEQAAAELAVQQAANERAQRQVALEAQQQADLEAQQADQAAQEKYDADQAAALQAETTTPVEPAPVEPTPVEPAPAGTTTPVDPGAAVDPGVADQAAPTRAGPPASASGNAVVAEGAKYLGTPYVLGGWESCLPYEMMDCSCFTATVYQAFGFSLPDSPGGQMGYGTPVSGPPAAGDLVFWSEDGSGYATHVGIAMGDGTVIHASAYAGMVVSGTPIDAIPGYMGARRLL